MTTTFLLNLVKLNINQSDAACSCASFKVHGYIFWGMKNESERLKITSGWTKCSPLNTENIFVIKILRSNICNDLAAFYYFTFHNKVTQYRWLAKSYKKFQSHFKINFDFFVQVNLVLTIQINSL